MVVVRSRPARGSRALRLGEDAAAITAEAGDSGDCGPAHLPARFGRGVQQSAIE